MPKVELPLKQVMIDLETLGTKTDSFILSIGATLFDDLACEIELDTFYGRINPEEQQHNRVIYGGSVKWWMNQTDEARTAAFSGQQSLGQVLQNFADWLEPDQYDIQPWGNGATFDVSIMEHAFMNNTLNDVPWPFWNICDMRTRVRDAERLTQWLRTDVERIGEHHNALEDSKYQAEVVCCAFQALMHGVD